MGRNRRVGWPGGLLLTALTLISPIGPGLRAQTAPDVRTEAGRILRALQARDSQAIYARLAPALRPYVSEARIRQRLREEPPIDNTYIQEIISGVDDYTVMASLRSGGRSRPLTLVLDENARLLAWEGDRGETSIEKTAIRFVEALAAGRFVQARALMSPEFQRDFPPEVLQSRWEGFQKRTGSFVRIRGAVVARSGGPQQLVLVTTEFRGTTDNLFIVLDGVGSIINVDFPIEQG